MNLLYQKAVEYSFDLPDQNPLDAAFWTPDTLPDPSLQIVSGQAVSADVSKLHTGVMLYTAFDWPDNQWAGIQVGALATDASAVLCGVRTSLDAQQGYYIFIGGPFGENLGFFSIEEDFMGSQNDLLILDPWTVNVGDVFRVGMFGSTIYAFQNGALIATVTNADIASGVVMLSCEPTGPVTDAGVTNFEGGPLVAADQGGTNNALLAAFALGGMS